MDHCLGKSGWLLAIALLLGGCGSGGLVDRTTEAIGLEDKAVEYKKSKQAESALELPPGLSSSQIEDSMAIPGGVSYSQYAKSDQQTRQRLVLPEPEGIVVERDRDKRWLVIQEDAEQLWPKLREFWLEMGFLLTIENPQVGIMETDWKENRADIPGDMIRDFLQSVLDTAYSAPTRDSFRLRLEEGTQPGVTEVFVTHRGVVERVSGDTIVWETRVPEPELEAEMLRRIMVYLGVAKEKANDQLMVKGQAVRAQIIKDQQGDMLINYQLAYPLAWRTVGVALDRIGFTVEGRDRSQGIYYVRYSDPLASNKKNEQGILSKLIFWGSDDDLSQMQYQVALAGDEVSTQVIVLDEGGQRDNSKTSQRILSLLAEQIR